MDHYLAIGLGLLGVACGLWVYRVVRARHLQQAAEQRMRQIAESLDWPTKKGL